MVLIKKGLTQNNITLYHVISMLKAIRADFNKKLNDKKDKKVDEKLFNSIDIRFKGIMSFLAWGATNAMSKMKYPIAVQDVYFPAETLDLVKSEITKLIEELKANEKDEYKQFVSIFFFIKAVYANGGKNGAWANMIECIKKFEGKKE